MKLAYVVSGVIADCPVPVEGFELADCFHDDYLAACVEVDDAARVGWVTTDGGKSFAAPPAAPALDLKAYAAAARYAKETGGIMVGNAPIATDRDSQDSLNRMWAAAQMNPGIIVSFKTSAGFTTINAAQIQTIASAVVAHVQACFAAEMQVDADVVSGKVTTPAPVDAAFAAIAV